LECIGGDTSYPDLVLFYATWPYLYSWASAAFIDFPAGAALAMGHAILKIINSWPLPPLSCCHRGRRPMCSADWHCIPTH